MTTIRYGFVHNEDKRKLLAKDDWGRTVLFDSEKEAIDFLEFFPNGHKDWTIKTTTMNKPKKPGCAFNLSGSYFK